MDVGGWLRNLGFGQYEPAFIENAIDGDVLSELTEDDLEKLGIPLGDRKRLIKAIKARLADSPDALITRGAREDAQSGQPRVAAAERRHLTVMICDLVGSTALSARLDPEDMGAVMEAYHAACASIVQAYDGFVGDFRGDGILAYFGYPRAHEDDAERTVRAGLDIIAAVARLKTHAAEPLAVRIGIATGLVVVGDFSGESELWEHAVIGDTPNLAARLQALAEPGTVVVAASTRRLLGDLFRLRELGWHKVKGIAEPVAAWAVEGVSASESRFEAVRAASLTDLIGREEEIEFLLEHQRLAWNGEGQIMLISGEAGIGKSRLAAALAERVADKHIRLRYQCSPYHSNSALRPFIVQLERAAGFKADDTPEQRLEKLEAVLAKGGSPIEAVAPLFAALLSIPFGDRYPPLALSPAQQRRRTLAALLDQFEGLSRRRPILFLFEDAHWADATSLELLDLAVERVRQLPVLALFTFRPDFEPPWIGLPNVGTLALGPLARNDVESIVARVTRGRALPAEVMKQIIAKTDGNPLFVEELTKTVLEAGILVEDGEGYRLDGPLPPLAIPETLQDSFMARLDRLAPVREIAQIGAAIGREFSYSLVRGLVGRDESALKHALAQLEQAELVFRRGEPPEAVYSFKHALVRDAAYESLLKSRRHQLHGRIARALEERFPDVVASEPEIVARHFTEAGLVDRAIDYWLKAGHLALSRSANAEAVKHLRQGIELTQSLAPSPERVRKELDFYLALGPAMAATEGDAAPETLKVFSHARNLLGDGGTLTEQMTVLWGAYLAHSMRAEHIPALAVARQCLVLAAQHEHLGISALANRFMGQTLHFMGAFVESRIHLERTLALCAANQATITDYRRFGTDDQANALSFLAPTLLLLGYPEKSAAILGQAVSRAKATGHAYSIALALSHVAFLGTIGCDPQRAAIHADEAIALSLEHGLASPGHRARFFRGALLAQNGDPEAGMELMRNAIAATEGNAERNRRTLYLSQLASAHASLGQTELAVDLLDEAIQTAEATGERFFEAELYRLRAEILLRLGRKEEAEAAMGGALTRAQKQQARWWELRAATSLANHWRAEGKYGDAYSLLEPVYSWFTEGFDTPDLKHAEALLDELRDLSGPQTQAAPRGNRSAFGSA
jgi:class 3 adenylate cyclase/tetratricopeptide (TPR) repeat protein/ABC-type transport system involved in cytochrome c biogenesis ATPase subunit